MIDVAYSVALHKQLLPACMIVVVSHVPCIVTRVMATTAVAASAVYIDAIAYDVALVAFYLSYCTSLAQRLPAANASASSVARCASALFIAQVCTCTSYLYTGC